MQDFLIGKNKYEIDNEYDKAIRDAGEERARAVFDAVDQKRMYNANKDYFDSIGATAPSAYNVSNQYEDYMNQLQKEREDMAKENKNNYVGDGLLGSLFNPIAQTVDAGADLTGGITTGNWDAWNKRDHLSDLASLGETALTLVPVAGGAMKAIRRAGAAANAASKAGKIGKAVSAVSNARKAHPVLSSMAYSGLYGGLGELERKGTDASLGDVALGTALGAGVGGILHGVGKGVGNVWNKYSAGVPSNSTELVRYAGGNAANTPAYQNALNTLGLSGDNLTSDAVNKARRSAMKNLASTVGYESAEGQAQRQAINNSYQTLQDVLNRASTGAQAQYVAPSLSLGEKWKNFGRNIPNMGRDLKNTKVGTKVSSLLGTKAGKIGAGVGGGLLLAKLMNGGGNNQDTGLSDEELMQLYNYYGGGY